MTPVEALTTFGPLALTGTAALLVGGIRRALGRVEGTIAPWAERLSRHSAKIHELDVALARLGNLPALLMEWRDEASREHQELQKNLERLEEMWNEGVNNGRGSG